MDPQSCLFAIAGFAIAFLFGVVFSRLAPATKADKRAYSIDGLRGYLAFGVLLHHGCIWYFLLHEGRWEAPSSRLYAHLGYSSVILFFMITAFLFTGKLLDERGTGVAWRKLYIGRAFRVMPLYLLMVAMLVALVFVATGPSLQVSPFKLFKALGRWVGLAFGQPAINDYARTTLIVAGVPWTLRYEVIFYAALPAMGLFMGCRPAWPWIVSGLVAITGIEAFGVFTDDLPIWGFVGTFAFGIAAAYVARSSRISRMATWRGSSVAVFVLLVLGVLASPSGLGLRSVFFFGGAFILIAAGNDLFGLLRLRASRFLGEISYGIYLFHGVVLYVAFTYLTGIPAAQGLGVVQHWAVVLACAPVVLLCATVAHLAVEKPGIRLGSVVANAGWWPSRRSEATGRFR